MAKNLKLICWNVNGIRAWTKKGCFDWFLEQNPDFFCIQETKAHPEQLAPEVLSPEGYVSYFDHSKTKKGYSGVAIYAKEKPEKVEDEIILDGKKIADPEGRFLALHYKDFVLINTYFPNGGGEPHRLEYKLEFYKAFLSYINKLKKKGKNVIFCGDVNVAHTEIDIARPKENSNHVGFLPIERAWVDKVIDAGFVDTFRSLHPDARNAYSWWDMKSAARDRNIGWRIDYFFVSESLMKKVKKSEILSEVYGSDHCPIVLEISI
jgi:exodeoxyribonuclease-3